MGPSNAQVRMSKWQIILGLFHTYTKPPPLHKRAMFLKNEDWELRGVSNVLAKRRRANFANLGLLEGCKGHTTKGIGKPYRELWISEYLHGVFRVFSGSFRVFSGCLQGVYRVFFSMPFPGMPLNPSKVGVGVWIWWLGLLDPSVCFWGPNVVGRTTIDEENTMVWRRGQRTKSAISEAL